MDSVIDLSLSNWSLGGVRRETRGVGQEHSTLAIRPPASNRSFRTIRAVDKREGIFYPFNGFASIPVVLYHEYLEQTREKKVFFF